MGLHDHPDTLRQEIQNQIAQIETDPAVEQIIMIYGMCGGELIGVEAQRCPLIIPRAHDCISLLLGSAERHQTVLRQNPATYFYSPGWIRGKRVPGPDRETYLRELYGQRYPDDPEIIEDLIEADQETFAHHNTAAYVDLTDNSTARTYCQSWHSTRVGNSKRYPPTQLGCTTWCTGHGIPRDFSRCHPVARSVWPPTKKRS